MFGAHILLSYKDIHGFMASHYAVMFIGMTFCLPLAFYSEKKQKQKRAAEAEAEADVDRPLLREFPRGPGNDNDTHNSWKNVLMLTIPTIFDLVATVLMNVGLLSVTASVYQMLRGAEMLFAALFAVVFLKRTLNKFHFAGIACCIAGISLVGASSMASAAKNVGSSDLGSQSSLESGISDTTYLQDSKVTTSPGQILLGMVLIIASQAVQAAQITFEDYFMVRMYLYDI